MIWTYAENQSIPVDPLSIKVEPTGNFYSNIAKFCEVAKIRIHPCLKEPEVDNNPLMQAALNPETLEKLEDNKEVSPVEKVVKKEITTLSIFTKRIDKGSIYGLQFAFPLSQIHTLKLSNNGFSYENCEVMIQAIAASNISRLFFDWNPIPSPKKKKDSMNESVMPDSIFAKLLENNKLEYLYLRANEIDDEMIPGICEKIIAHEKLKCLDLSMNLIKGPGVKQLAMALRANASIELFGLGSMGLTIADLKPLLAEIGKVKLTEEEANSLKEKIKDRDAILEKNKKAKGKKEEPVPKVNDIFQDDQGICYELKKKGFKHLNIGLNSLDDAATPELDQLLSRTDSHFVVTVASKMLGKESCKLLISKYGERAVI